MCPVVRRTLLARTLVAGPLAASLALLLVVAHPGRLSAWGEFGHRLVGRRAAAALPREMPGFFRNAGAQLEYLNPEPDRWRERAERELDPALDGATAPDHFINLELVPADRRAALRSPTRYAFADSLRAMQVEPATVGMLPFRIVELTQELRTDFRRWRGAPDSTTRAWIEQRIIDDAGILGHYVADGANPAHTSVQYNGWTGANPDGYTTDRTFHSRFESAYVQARIVDADVSPLVGRTPQVIPDLRSGVLAYLNETRGELRALYELEKASPFTPTNADAAHRRFTAARLAAGATMLRDLWWTAWVTSGLPIVKER
jgi:hypothetical protein